MLACGHFAMFPWSTAILPYGHYSDFTLTKELIKLFLTEGYTMKRSILSSTRPYKRSSKTRIQR